MKQAFVVIVPDADSPCTLSEARVDADPIDVLTAGDLVYIEETIESEATTPSGWREAEYRPTPTALGSPGWLQTKFIGSPAVMAVPPVAIAGFVRRCGRAEIAANAGGAHGAPAILADYLLALAEIESEFTKFENRLAGTSAVGPFQISEEEWTEFLQANPDGDFSPFQRFQALAQVQCAAYLTQRDWKLLQQEASTAAIEEPQQEYIPSFLLLFQSRLVGAKAAFAINKIHASDELHQPLEDALAKFYPDAADLGALIKRRRRFLNQGSIDVVTTVDEFVEKTANILADAFKSAFGLLKIHFPEFVALPTASDDKPWLATAQAEELLWKDSQLTEDTAAGKKRIKEYFSATSYHPDSVEPWCGAFAAWCMSQNQAPSVEGAATAANWKNWGTLELRKGSLYEQGIQKTLAGAVVILHASKDTGTTGHVCFAINRLETSDKIKCVGGNQRNTVRTDSLDISRIASIRLLVPIVPPTGDDQLILARTIFGEAAGEPVEGKEAVAEVVVNRAASGRYPKSVSSVCLQPYQFSCWNANDTNRRKILSLSPGNGNRAFDVCFDVAGRALSGTIHHFTDGVLHYHADYISKPSWVIDSPHAVMERKIGHHLFYSGIS